MKNLSESVSNSIEERLKDPIIGTFAVSFLLSNWDLALVLVNYKADFHQNIFFIKSALAPIKLTSPPGNFSEFFTSYIRGWHLLRFILPLALTYVWLLKWPEWTEKIFTLVQTSKLGRKKIVTDLEKQLLSIKEDLITAKEETILAKEETINIKEENLNLQSELLNANEKKWDQDFVLLLEASHLNELKAIAENKNNDKFLNQEDIAKTVNKYSDLGLIVIHQNSNYAFFHVESISLTEKGQYFYKKLLLKSP